jgi:hypothetical protein
MEFLNYVDSLKGTHGSRPNKTKNCSITIFHIKPSPDKGFIIDTVVENEVSHLVGGGEDRLIGKGNG